MNRLLLMATAAIVLAVLPGCGSSENHSSISLQNADIFALQLGNDTSVVNLTDNPKDDYYPSWNPDGTQIAFSTNRDFNFEIYTMDADGSNQTNISDDPSDDWEPSWSASVDKIAFASDRNGNPDICVMNPDGTDVTRLTDNAARDWEPAWSPDGGKLAFASDRDGDFEIYTMQVPAGGDDGGNNGDGGTDGTAIAAADEQTDDGSNGTNDAEADNDEYPEATQLTDNDVDDRHPAWAPDGETIVYLRDENDGRLYSMVSDGSDGSVVRDTDWMDSSISFSSDGAFMAYTRRRSFQWPAIYVMSPAGDSRVTELEQTPDEADAYPAWSPDGQTLLFTRWKRVREAL